MAFEKNKPFKNISGAFPKEWEEDINCVCTELVPTLKPFSYGNKDKYYLSSGAVELPYRCYNKPLSQFQFGRFTERQKKIFACICLLNYNGFVRERYLRYLLEQPLEEWILPFLMKVSGEYVKEILIVLYEDRKDKDNTLFKEFSKMNPRQSERNLSRMISYWNEYYRFDIIRPCVRDGRKGARSDIRDYVGYSLFRECFGISPRRKRVNNYDNN